MAKFLGLVFCSDSYKQFVKWHWENLRFHLTGTSRNLQRVLSLISANYWKAVEILKERHRNKQIFISSYMDVLVKLPKVDNMNDIDKLCKIYNSLEMSVKNLANLGVELSYCGILLIIIILDRIRLNGNILFQESLKVH